MPNQVLCTRTLDLCATPVLRCKISLNACTKRSPCIHPRSSCCLCTAVIHYPGAKPHALFILHPMECTLHWLGHHSWPVFPMRVNLQCQEASLTGLPPRHTTMSGVCHTHASCQAPLFIVECSRSEFICPTRSCVLEL